MNVARHGVTAPDAAFDRITRAASRLLGVRVALSTHVTPEPVAIADVRQHPELSGDADVARLGAVAYAGFPIFAGGRAIGSLSAVSPAPRRWSDDDLALLEDLAGMAQAQLDLQESTRAARVAEREQAGAEAAAGVLRRLVDLMDVAREAQELDALLGSVARTAADALAAPVAAIALRGDDGRLRLRAVTGLSEDLVGMALDDTSWFVERVVREGRELAVPDVSETDPSSPRLRQYGMRAALGAPLRDGGRITGVIAVADSGVRAWSELEVQLLRLAADRLATAFERARASDHAREIADRLQRALEPTRLPEVAGVTLAARYRPAEGRIGGDWYDVFALSGSRLGMAIGDVVGHGIRAAAAAVRLRHHLRGLLLRRMRPGEALRGLDAFVADEPDSAFSSVLYAELDLAARTVRWASAGHLPPVLLREGAVTPLGSAGGSLLGVTALDPWPERTLALLPGDRLVLYTDGLVERPGVPIDEDIAATFAAVAGEPGAVDALCERLLAGPAVSARDDVAVLVAGVD